MHKTLLPVLFSFLVAGCGGDPTKNADISALVEGKPYYEEDACNDPKYTSYTIDSKKLEIKSFNDADYSELVATKTYEVLKFDDIFIEIQKDGEKLDCTASNTVTDKPAVIMYMLDCNNYELTNTLIYKAYDTKERAHTNKLDGDCP